MKAASVIGKSVKRSDVLEKVTGEAQYVADMTLPGLLHGKQQAQQRRARADPPHRHRAARSRCRA